MVHVWYSTEGQCPGRHVVQKNHATTYWVGVTYGSSGHRMPQQPGRARLPVLWAVGRPRTCSGPNCAPWWSKSDITLVPVSEVRVSFAAPSDTNFGKKGALATL